MFVRISTYDVPEDRLGEAELRFGEALGEISTMNGLSDAYFLISRESNHAVTVVVWDSYDAMAASRVTASRLRIEASRDVGAEVLSVDEFEVATRLGGVSEPATT